MRNQIAVIGVNHNDPLGRASVNRILHRWNESKQLIPDCIAVEWAESHFNQVKQQRGRMKQLVGESFAFLSEEDIDMLASSLGYEGDSHLELYPNLPVLWLGEGRVRDIQADTLVTYASDRMRIIRMYWPQHTADGNIMSALSRNLWEIAGSSRQFADLSRDSQWHSFILDAFSRGNQQIACIVGATHADVAVENTLAWLLRQQGIDVITDCAREVSLR